MHRSRRNRGVPAVVSAAIVCAVVLAACGGSSGKGGGSAQSGASAGIKFADCMRSHGVPNFPDPSPGGGIQLTPGSGINPQSPAFQSAQSACSRLMPGPAGGGGQTSETRKLRMLHLAQCMRKHGLPSFPDPTASPPSPGNGIGLAFGGPGSFIAVPQNLIQSPAFKQAATACGFPGARGRRAGKANFAPG